MLNISQPFFFIESTLQKKTFAWNFWCFFRSMKISFYWNLFHLLLRCQHLNWKEKITWELKIFRNVFESISSSIKRRKLLITNFCDRNWPVSKLWLKHVWEKVWFCWQNGKILSIWKYCPVCRSLIRQHNNFFPFKIKMKKWRHRESALKG